MPIRKAGERAYEALIDRLRNVEDGAVLDEVKRVLDAHEGTPRPLPATSSAAAQADPQDGGELLQLQDDDVDDVLRLLLGADDQRPL